MNSPENRLSRGRFPSCLFALVFLFQTYSWVGQGWLADLWSHLTLHLTLVMLWLCVHFIILRLRGRAIAAFLAVGIGIFQIVDAYAWFSTAPVSKEPKHVVRVLQMNVFKEGYQSARVLQMISAQDPDIITLQEIDDRWAKELSPLAQRYPWRKVIPMDTYYGIAVYSKIPIQKFTVDYLGTDFIPAIYAHMDGAYGINGLWAVRFYSPVSPHRWKIRQSQMRILRDGFLNTKGSYIISGDWNITPYSKTFKDFCSKSFLYKPSVGYLKGTWPLYVPWPLRIPIDHLLTSGDARVVSRQVLPYAGSDHMPVIYKVAT